MPDFAMEKRKWLWKRKSSERSSGEAESSGSISSHSERFSDDQDGFKASPINNAQSPEVTSKTLSGDEDVNEDVNDSVKSLTERLSAALVNVSVKDDLVKQHAKVAEEAVAGWEKAENEVVALKKQLEAAIQQNLALEERVSHLDGALKECVRQLRQAREDQEEKIHEAVAKKSREWESTKSELENEVLELKTKAEAAKIEPDICYKLEFLEQENASMKLKLLSQSEELEVRTIERDLSTQAAETASKQHLESIKKIAKLEAECRRLKSMAYKLTSLNDTKTSAASSTYVESFTDSQSESGERLNTVELDTCKMICSEPKCEPSCSDSWASALIAELDQFKDEKTVNRNLSSSSINIDLMDDFLEMERLASLPENEGETHHSEPESIPKQSTDAESLLRAELEIMIHRTTELEEKLLKVEVEKVELEEKLEKLNAERSELEVALTRSWDRNEASQLQLREVQLKLEELQEELSLAIESKQKIESQITSMEVEARTMSEKVNSLEGEIEKEKLLSAEIAIKCQELEKELYTKKQEAELQEIANATIEPKIKQEDLDLAARKLSDCQKTIASLGKRLKSLATLEDFLIDTGSLPGFSAGGSLIYGGSGEPWQLHSNETFSPKRDSGSSRITGESSGPSVNKSEGNSPPSSSSSTSSAALSNHVSSEKNRNGFANFFSRSKNGIQLEI